MMKRDEDEEWYKNIYICKEDKCRRELMNRDEGNWCKNTRKTNVENGVIKSMV